MAVEFQEHDMRRKSAHGHGSWDQCENCGATKHNGYWWLGGYKSKEKPKCQIWPIDAEWKSSAIMYDELSGVKG